MEATGKKIFIIIPAYNEAKNLGKVLADILKEGYQPVVIDDGSGDETSDIAWRSGAVVLRHFINRGQGAALETGDLYALGHGADIAVHFDADGQFNAGEIADVVRPILAGEADIVFGSRFMDKISNIPVLKKKLIFPLANMFNKAFLGIKMTDPQSGFRALSREALKGIRIENDGMAHCSEILSKAFKLNYRIREVPITVAYHEFGQKFSGGLKIIKDLLISKILN